MIYGREIPPEILIKIKAAETVRDQIMHGRPRLVDDKEKRKAIAEVLDYSKELSSFIKAIAGFEPFGNLKGFNGGGHPLGNTTTKWVLKGMSFPVS